MVICFYLGSTLELFFRSPDSSCLIWLLFRSFVFPFLRSTDRLKLVRIMASNINSFPHRSRVGGSGTKPSRQRRQPPHPSLPPRRRKSPPLETKGPAGKVVVGDTTPMKLLLDTRWSGACRVWGPVVRVVGVMEPATSEADLPPPSAPPHTPQPDRERTAKFAATAAQWSRGAARESAVVAGEGGCTTRPVARPTRSVAA